MDVVLRVYRTLFACWTRERKRHPINQIHRPTELLANAHEIKQPSHRTNGRPNLITLRERVCVHFLLPAISVNHGGVHIPLWQGVVLSAAAAANVHLLLYNAITSQRYHSVPERVFTAWHMWRRKHLYMQHRMEGARLLTTYRIPAPLPPQPSTTLRAAAC